MSRINFNVPVLDLDGTPVEEVKLEKTISVDKEGKPFRKVVVGEDGTPVYEPVLMRNMVCNLLFGQYEGDDKLPGTERLARGKLAKKIYNNRAKYTIDEKKLILDLAAKGFTTQVLTQLDAMLNGEDEESGEDEGGSEAEAA